jgi:hypothetical protein
MKHQVIVDKEELDDELKRHETIGFWKAVEEMHKVCEGRTNYTVGSEVSLYQVRKWNDIVEAIRLSGKYK